MLVVRQTPHNHATPSWSEFQVTELATARASPSSVAAQEDCFRSSVVRPSLMFTQHSIRQIVPDKSPTTMHSHAY
jgi:hypothetical protein